MASLVLGAIPMTPKALSLSPTLSSSRTQSLVCLSLSTSSLPSTPPLIYCGRGDKKTAKGKRFKHFFGNARPRNKNKGRGPPRAPVPPSPPRKDRFEDDEKVTIEIDETLFST
ncbi:30S ribosomal protein [Actinidia chinensis var. chinensis]|uniref:30S ribosomal protein n=1 Tax=Actinidia chinensis var. chinensis TaxID=1590841 RepID=A0A2R6RWU5_ACTCC|nr:30S ribosomal protein [Actinidia chinensis var. chinensis]